MKILMHCVYFPPEVGGLESHVHQLCRALVGRGHEVDVVTSRSRPALPKREVVDGIRVWRTPMPGRSPVGWLLHALGSVPRTRALAGAADVVHAQSFASIVPCALAGAGRSVPVVATLHTSHFLTRARSALWRPVLARLVRRPDHVLAASREIATVAEELAKGTRVEALTNGVDTSLFRPVEPQLPPSDGPRIVVPRRLFAKNGVEDFVRAFPEIAGEVEGVEAVLVGDGPERERIVDMIHRDGLQDRVRLLGARPHHEMPGILSSADLAVFPSHMEATSVAALECMACEVPVAASRIGGLPEIVDEDVGGLFEARNPSDLARVVASLLKSGDLEERGRRARRRVVERWSNDRLAERHLEIYRMLTDRGKPDRTRSNPGDSKSGESGADGAASERSLSGGPGAEATGEGERRAQA